LGIESSVLCPLAPILNSSSHPGCLANGYGLDFDALLDMHKRVYFCIEEALFLQ
jgi:hypothetical protein